MLADYESKPNQGNLFRKQRAELIRCPIDYNNNVEHRRTKPNLLPKIEADTAGGIVEKNPGRVSVKDILKAVRLESGARSAHADTQAIVNKGKFMSQRVDNRPLGQRRSVLDGPSPCRSVYGTGYTDKYTAGVLYLPVEKSNGSDYCLA